MDGYCGGLEKAVEPGWGVELPEGFCREAGGAEEDCAAFVFVEGVGVMLHFGRFWGVRRVGTG